jgi:hypothetical protein
MNDQYNKPPTVSTVNIGEYRVRFEDGEATLEEPIHMPLGRVERDGKQWKATSLAGRAHDTHTRRNGAMWLIEESAGERAKREADDAEQAAAQQAESEQRDADRAAATEVAMRIIRSIRPDYEMPRAFSFRSELFVFSPVEMSNLLVALVKPGPRVLPTDQAAEYLAERTVVLCHLANATAEEPMPEPHPWLWGAVSDAYADVEADQASVTVTFEGDHAGEFNEVHVACLEVTAVVSQDAVTFTNLDGGFLVAAIAEEADTVKIAGLDGITDEWDRDSLIMRANGPPSDWWNIPEDELGPENMDDAPGHERAPGE